VFSAPVLACLFVLRSSSQSRDFAFIDNVSDRPYDQQCAHKAEQYKSPGAAFSRSLAGAHDEVSDNMRRMREHKEIDKAKSGDPSDAVAILSDAGHGWKKSS
jgi:hypothetical protein